MRRIGDADYQARTALGVPDLFVFRGREGTALALVLPPDTVSVFDPEARYELKVDFTGDSIEDLTYRVLFGRSGNGGQQSVAVTRTTGEAASDPFAPGDLVAAGMTGRCLQGRHRESFWAGIGTGAAPHSASQGALLAEHLNYGVRRPIRSNEPTVVPGRRPGARAIVLELPDSLLERQHTIRAWAVSSAPTAVGGWLPVCRAGLPLIALLSNFADSSVVQQLAAGIPAEDRWFCHRALSQELETLVSLQGELADAEVAAHARRLSDRMLPNVLTYEVGSPAQFAVSKWNGRNLTDAALEVLIGELSGPPLMPPAEPSAGHADAFPYLTPS